MSVKNITKNNSQFLLYIYILFYIEIFYITFYIIYKDLSIDNSQNYRH